MVNLDISRLNYCIQRTKAAIEILFVYGDKHLADALTEFLAIPEENIPEELSQEVRTMYQRCNQLPKETGVIAWNVLHMHWQQKRKVRKFLWDFLQKLEEIKLRTGDGV